MSGRRTAALGVTLLLLATYFAIFEGFAVTPELPEWERAEKMLDCRSATPRELAVSTDAGTVAAKNVQGRWETDAGGLAPSAFDALAEVLCRLPVIERIPAETSLADFGLEPPAAKVKIGLAGTKELWLGAATPAENLMYARFADRPDVLKLGVELKGSVERVAQYAKRPAT